MAWQKSENWKAEREERVHALVATAENAIKALIDSDEMKRWLTTASRFHTYSLNNQVLILTQRPDATRVAGFKTWQKLGKPVRKGEHGIRILAPTPKKYLDERGEEQVHLYFKVVSVFDVSQTSGDPLPEPPLPVELEGESAVALHATERAVAWLAQRGIRYSVEPRWGSAHGAYAPGLGLVKVADDLSPNQHAKTVLHELAHVMADHQPGDEGRPTREVEAELASFIALGALGFDTSQYTLPYVAGWAGETKVFEAALKGAVALGKQVLEVVEQEPVADEATGDTEEVAA